MRDRQEDFAQNESETRENTGSTAGSIKKGRNDGAPAPASPVSAASQPIVRMEKITKRFGGVHALRNVSLSIRAGEVFALLGSPGAGKTSLARITLGFLHPDEGTVRVFGSDNLTRAHARTGYLPEKPRYHGNFTGRDYLRFHAGLTGLRERDAVAAADKALQTVGIPEAGERRIGGYSKDTLQRFGLAVALVSGGMDPPDLLILDEPALGLDGDGQITFKEIILECRRRGSAALICSHQLTEVERAATAAGVLRAGRLIAQTPLDESPRVHIAGVPRRGADEILPHLVEYLHRLHSDVSIRGGHAEGEPLHVSIPTGPGVPHAASLKAAALRAIVDGRWDIISVHVESKDLESLYAQAVQEPVRKQAERRDDAPSPRRATAPLAAGEPEQQVATEEAAPPAVVPEPAAKSATEETGTAAEAPVTRSEGKSTAPLGPIIEQPEAQVETHESPNGREDVADSTGADTAVETAMSEER